jgi:hypothetical protein
MYGTIFVAKLASLLRLFAHVCFYGTIGVGGDGLKRGL